MTASFTAKEWEGLSSSRTIEESALSDAIEVYTKLATKGVKRSWKEKLRLGLVIYGLCVCVAEALRRTFIVGEWGFLFVGLTFLIPIGLLAFVFTKYAEVLRDGHREVVSGVLQELRKEQGVTDHE